MENATAVTPPPPLSDAQVRERITRNLRHMAKAAEQLLETAQHAGHEQLGAARDKLEAQLKVARSEVLRLEGSALRQARRAAHATDHALHEHPYAAVGVAAGVGLLLGLLIARR